MVGEMHLVIDHAGQQPSSGGIDFLVGAGGDAWRDLVDAAMTDQQIALEHSAFIDQAGVADEQGVHASLGGRLAIRAGCLGISASVGLRHQQE